MKRRTLCLLSALFVLTVFISSKQVLAAPYYEGKTVRIIVGFGPGGGYDRLSRLLAKNLPKYIPGKPTIIVENMEGASSIKAANYIYNIAKPDGLTIGTFTRGLPFAQLLKVVGVMFDMSRYSWIGSAAVEATVLVVRTDLPYKTFDDLLKTKKPIHMGATGPGSLNYQFCAILKEYFGLNINFINYRSSTDILLAIERKEVDGLASAYSSLRPAIERGLVRPLIRGSVSEPGIENLPVNEDLVTDNKIKTVMAMLSSTDLIGRPFVAPPGTPIDVMNILRDSFAKVAKDPELKEESKKIMMTVKYVPADESLKVLNHILKQPEDVVKEFSKYVKF